MRFLKSKTLIILTLLVFVLYLSNDFSLIDIKETALIVALGIDKEDDLFEVSAQIAIPQATDQTASNNAAVISGKGETIALAIENIGAHTGWYPNLSFCNIIILGNGLFDGDIMQNIDYFIRTVKIQDTAALCAAEKTAKEVLNISSPLEDFSAFSISKILEKDAETSSSVSTSSIREFAMGYYSKSGFSLMPKIKLLDAGNKADEKSQPSAAKKMAAQKVDNKSGQGEQDGQTSGGQSKKIFDATETVLFSKGRRICVIDKDQTLILNLLNHKVSEASLELHNQNYLGKQTGLFITLRENSGNVKLKIKDNRPTLIVTLNITARLDDTNITVPPEELAKSYIVPDNILRDVEELIETKLHEIFSLSVEKNCDIFEIKDKLFRTQNKYYEGYKDIIINETSFLTNVTAKSFK